VVPRVALATQRAGPSANGAPLTEEKFVASGRVHLWTERSGDPGTPAVLLIMGTSAQGIGWPDEVVDTLVAGGGR
jgi:hypothetical protein